MSGVVVGVSDHGGWAVLVTASSDGTLLDRRRVELVDEGLPKIPHHHEAQGLPIDDGVRLVEQVRVSAEKHARLVLDTLAKDVPGVRGIALRECPPLPPTIAERLTDYRARNNADWVMYRKALASAAEAKGWRVHWYNAKTVVHAASEVLDADIEARSREVRKEVGPPWGVDHKVAMAASMVAAASR